MKDLPSNRIFLSCVIGEHTRGGPSGPGIQTGENLVKPLCILCRAGYCCSLHDSNSFARRNTNIRLILALQFHEMTRTV